MIEQICEFLLRKIRKKMPEIQEEQAEIIKYGIQLIIGETPKMFILFGLGFFFGIGWYTLLAYVAIMPYRGASGGFHLKTHLGCILGTSLFYYGNVLLSITLTLNNIQKIVLVFITFIFSIIMINLYAPADTENVPIISKKERRNKKILSYITMTITLLISLIIKNNIISNLLVFGVLIQSISITRIAYKITKNKYGYEIYQEQLESQA